MEFHYQLQVYCTKKPQRSFLWLLIIRFCFCKWNYVVQPLAIAFQAESTKEKAVNTIAIHVALSVNAIEIFWESVAKTSNQERIPEYNHPEVGRGKISCIFLPKIFGFGFKSTQNNASLLFSFLSSYIWSLGQNVFIEQVKIKINSGSIL